MEVEENQQEENGFSNRRLSTTFIPPLTINCMQNKNNTNLPEKTCNMMNIYVLNTGLASRVKPSLKGIGPQATACLKNVLGVEATLINTPYGQIEYQSRRRGSCLEFGFAKGCFMLSEHVVSPGGNDRQVWDEFFARYHDLQRLGAVPGGPAPKLQPPANESWCATIAHAAWIQLRPPELENFGILQGCMAAAFLTQFNEDRS